MKKRKCLNLGPKMPYLDIFGLNFKKTRNKHPLICQTAKFSEKEKISKFGTKKVLFLYFGVSI